MIFLRLFCGCMLQLVPFAVLSFYPHKEHLRFSKTRTCIETAVLVVLLSLVFSSICLHISTLDMTSHYLYLWSNAVFMACVMLCFIWYLFAVKSIWQHKVFTFFFTITAALSMTSIENAVDTWLEQSVVTDGLPYYGNSIWTLAIMTIITIPALWLLLKKLYLPVADVLNQKETNYLSILSVILFMFLAGGLIPLEYSEMYNAVSMYLFFALMFSVFIIYGVSFQFLALSHEKLVTYERMIQMKHQLQMLDEQYTRIQDKIEISQKNRHDIRHHFVALQGLLKNGDINGATTYLERYVEDLEKNKIPNICENTVLNTVIGCYAQQAEDHEIEFRAKVNIPELLNVQDEDLAVLLGNLLENSITAAARADKDNRFITMNILVSGNMLVVAVDNGFDGKIKKKNERYLSLKDVHIGYGLSSIQSIAEKYDGGVEFSDEINVFHSSVMLNIGR